MIQKRAWRTAAMVVVGLHLVHCPSASFGPDTGCVQNTKNVGRFFPDLTADAGLVVLVRLDESGGTTTPAAEYVSPFLPPPAGAIALVPRLDINDCRCVRTGDGQDCTADAGMTDTGNSTAGEGTPIFCAPISIFGVNAHGPILVPDSGFTSPDCVFSESDCNPGERCLERRCSAPVALVYDPGSGQYVASAARIDVSPGTQLTVELGAFVADAGLSTTCPAGTTTGSLTVVPPTTLLAPVEGAAVSRAEPLTVSWEGNDAGSPAGFAVALIRGARGDVDRTIVCRGLDTNQSVTFTPAVLSALDPGAVELELVRMNATAISPFPVQGALLSVSSRKRMIRLK